MLKLNIGAGNTRIPDYTGIDVVKGDGVDVICDITKEKLPFPDDSVDHVIMHHVVEHICEKQHPFVFLNLWRVMKPGAEIFLAYPEFKIIAQNYIENKNSIRDYWKMTIYGRQAHVGDFHVTLMDTDYFIDDLHNYGFEIVKRGSQVKSEFNTLLLARKSVKPTSREELLNREIFGGN